MKSMTGFGRGEKEVQGHVFTVEVKTVNHRYLESAIRLSRKLSALEGKVRSVLKEKISRGKTDVFINYANHSQQQGSVWINNVKLAEYLKVLREQGQNFGLEDDLKLSHVLQLPEIMETEESQADLEAMEPILLDALNEALGQLNAMREREGENLKKDFQEKLGELEALVAQIQERAPLVVQEYKEKLYTRIQEYLDKNKVPEFDESRLEVEITMFADRCCIDEELIRLGSHIRQYRQALEKKEPVGRQLDFLTQELNRETNTIASKSNDLTITQYALTMKNVIEKIREQIQNIE